MTDRTFGEKDARDDVREYHKHGPPGQTRQMLKAIGSLGLHEATLLDIGGGVGVLHHELLQDVVLTATHVDASSAYLSAAREEAARLGHAARVEFIHADFTDIASSIPEADVVTLDRVVCCYPDFQRLLSAAGGRCRQALVLAYPRETWYVRLVIQAINFLQGLRKEAFRVFLHPVGKMEAVLQTAGLQRVSLQRLFVWEVALYTR
jgi:2-polyprenyl-3-methyl-5-hydroxy-6-metoxy-1,4-benzoquinol methylase